MHTKNYPFADSGQNTSFRSSHQFRHVKLILCLIFIALFGFNNLHAQCECADYGLQSMSIIDTDILPFCDEIQVNTTVSNIDPECEANLILRVTFSTVLEGFDPLYCITYLGNLPFSQTFFSISSGEHYTRFSFSLSDIPPLTDVNTLIRFGLESTEFDLYSAYPFTVDVISQDPSCGADPGPNTSSSTVFVSSGLTEMPISGQVSDLLVSGDLSTGYVQRKIIDGILEVDTDFSFISQPSSRPVLYLFPGTQILVKSGSTLNLSNAIIFTCDELAQGIIVEPGATLIMDGCDVSDSRFGVDARAGSTLSVTNTDFADNYIGVRFDMAGAPNRVTIDAFNGNHFFTDDGVKTPFAGMPEQVETRGYCGIYVNNYRDFNIWGDNATGPNFITFNSLANGIVGYNSYGNLGNMTFNDMNSVDAQKKYNFEGFGIRLQSKGTHWFNLNEFWTTMTFNNCKTGILATNYALNVENTTMTNVGVGIDVSLGKKRDIVLDGNTITAQRVGIRSGLNEPVHPVSKIRSNILTITNLGTGTSPVTGIQMEEIGLGFTPPPGQTVPLPPGVDGWKVTGNTVTLQKGGRGILYRNGFAGELESNNVNDLGQVSNSGEYNGIQVDGTTFSQINFNDVTRSTNAGGNADSRSIHSKAGFSNAFTCNCVDNTGVGLQFFDMADFTNNVKGNKLNNHDGTGIQLSGAGIGNAFIGIQEHTGNEWVVSPSGFGAINWGGTPQIVNLSKFWVDPNEKSGALSPDVDPVDWFEPVVTTPLSFDCDSGCSAPTIKPPFEGENDTPTFLDEAIATEKLYPDVFEDETNWKGAYRLYRKILRQPAIETYASEFEDFVDTHENLSTGKLAYIAEEKAKLFSLSTVEDSLLEDYRLEWRTKMTELKGLDSLRQKGTSVNPTQYDDAVDESAEAQGDYETYWDDLVEARQTQIQSLLTLNAAVSVSLTPAVNHKTVNAIVLNFLLSDTLATGNLATLESIAEQCPLEGGDAVYEARAIVSYYTGSDYDDYTLCASPQPRQQQISRKPSELAKGLSLYPNPTTGEVFLPVSDEVLVRVFNNIGQLQIEKTVSDSRLNLSQLQPGVYRFQLFREGQMLTTQNVVLLNR